MIACRKIILEDVNETLYYMNANPAYFCYTPTHTFYLIIVVIPSLIVWLIILPLFIFFSLLLSTIYFKFEHFGKNPANISIVSSFRPQHHKL